MGKARPTPCASSLSFSAITSRSTNYARISASKKARTSTDARRLDAPPDDSFHRGARYRPRPEPLTHHVALGNVANDRCEGGSRRLSYGRT